MNVDMEFGQLGRTEELESYLSSQVSKLESKVSDKTDVKVWVDLEKSIESTGQPLFNTRIRLSQPGQRELFLKYSGHSLQQCMSNLISLAKTRLRRRKSRWLKKRRSVPFSTIKEVNYA